jgi:hypothetical protein
MDRGTTRTLAARTRLARYFAACLLVVIGAVWLLTQAPRLCHQEIPATGTSPVRVCGPPGIGDTATVAWLAVVVLLLAPDLAEVVIGGVTLRRAVEEAKADAATARADVAAIRLSVTRLHQDVDVTSTAESTTVVQSGDAAMLETLARLGLLRGVADEGDAEPGGAPSATPAETAQALTLVEGVERARALLPPAWREGAFIGIAGEVTVLAGADMPQSLVSRLLSSRDGAIARARRGEYAMARLTRAHPAVVAAPVWDSEGGVLGAVALIPPAGADLGSDEAAAAVQLAAAAAVFAPVARYAVGGARPTALSPGPFSREEAP